jgi:hypothetical protein
LIGVARKSASIAGARCSARQEHKTRQTITRQWMAAGVHDAMTMRSRVEMAFVVARPWRLGLGSSRAGALAMWQCGWPFHVSTDFGQVHRSFFPLTSCNVLGRSPFTDHITCDSRRVDAQISEAGILSTDRAMFSARDCWTRQDTIATPDSPVSYGAYIHIPTLT